MGEQKLMTDDKIRLIFEKCPLDKSNDKKLPSDSFVVSYEEDKELKYDIIRAAAQVDVFDAYYDKYKNCLLYTSPSPRDRTRSRMPSSA